jgi:O-methyltransferase involved in polyketide biosynthesis
MAGTHPSEHPDKHRVRLGAVQETLFITLAARARETQRKHPAVARSRGPYCFVAEGVLVYLPEDQVMAALARIAARFPGALIVLGTYPKRTFDQQHKLVARKGIEARWAWACDDPRSLERLGLEVRQSATITRPPRAMRAQLPFGYRYLVPLADPVVGKAMTLTLFRASSRAAGGPDATARAAGTA